ncbi:MAG: hypothetical protein CVT94_15035, partial [Bacteroidetes bacterium HGW-Bacteroidetes-11]
MKYFIFIFTLTFFSLSVFSQDFWEQINNPGAQIYDITVDPQGRIYLATSNINTGGVYRSDDNGETWQHKSNGIPYPYTRAIAFYRDSTLFTSLFSKLYRTYDLGENWQLVYEHFPEATSFDVIRCGFDSIILAGGENSRGMLRSVDNGETWENVLNLSNPDHYEHVEDICFGPGNSIYACTSYTNVWSDEQPKVYRSDDFGKTWIPFFSLATPSAYYSLEIDNNGRLLVGGWSGIYRYDFVLQQWEHIPINTSVRDIIVVPDNRIFLACDQNGAFRGVLLSEDGGDTYSTVINSGLISNHASEFEVTLDGRLLMNQSSKSIYRSNDAIFTDIDSPILVNELLNCFPNPFINYFILKSKVNKPMHVELFNNLGFLMR